MHAKQLEERSTQENYKSGSGFKRLFDIMPGKRQTDTERREGGGNVEK